MFFKHVSDRFSDLFSRFSNRSSYRFKSFSGADSFCRHAALSLSAGFDLFAFFDAPVFGHASDDLGVLSTGFLTEDREEKNMHDHHRKKIYWGTFLA